MTKVEIGLFQYTVWESLFSLKWVKPGCSTAMLILSSLATLNLVGTQRYNVVSMSMQRHDVASTLMRRCINVMCPLGRLQISNVFRWQCFSCFAMSWHCMDVDAMLYKGHVPTGKASNKQCIQMTMFFLFLYKSLNFWNLARKAWQEKIITRFRTYTFQQNCRTHVHR